VFTKSGRGVTVSASDELIQSTDVAVSATTFVVTGCRAWDTVSPDLRPRCISLMDANRPDWYVRQSSSYLRVELESSDPDVPQFQQDASFILHVDSFYPGYYALESLNFPDNYMCLQDDGDLWIEPEAYTTAYIDAASFTYYEHDSSRKCNIYSSIVHVTISACFTPNQWVFQHSRVPYLLGKGTIVSTLSTRRHSLL